MSVEQSVSSPYTRTQHTQSWEDVTEELALEHSLQGCLRSDSCLCSVLCLHPIAACLSGLLDGPSISYSESQRPQPALNHDTYATQRCALQDFPPWPEVNLPQCITSAC